MRIGEILIRSGLINSQQLQEALDYAAYKQVPVGRALRVLKHLNEDDLSRCIEAQMAIKKGLEGKQALSILKVAAEAGRTFNYALENSPMANKNVPRVLIDFILDKSGNREWNQPATYKGDEQSPRNTGTFPAPSTQNPRNTGTFPSPKQPAADPRSTGTHAAPSTQNPRSTGSFPAPSTKNPRSTGTFAGPSAQPAKGTPPTHNPSSTGSFASRPAAEKAANNAQPEKPQQPAQKPHQKFSLTIPKIQLPFLGNKPAEEKLSQSSSGNPVAPPQPAAPQERKPAFEELIEQADKDFVTNRLQVAEQGYNSARLIAEQNFKSNPQLLSITLTKLANLYLGTDQFGKAQPLFERILELQEEQFGIGTAQVTRALEDLSELHDVQNKLPEATKLLEAALESFHKQTAPDFALGGRLLKRLLHINKRYPLKSTRTRLGELAVDAGLISADQLQTAFQSSKQSGATLGSTLRSMNFVDSQQVESLMYAQLLVKQNTLPATIAVHAIRIANTNKIPLRHFCETGKFLSERESNDYQYQQLVLEQEKMLATEARLGPNHLEVAKMAQRVADIHLARKDRAAAEMLYKRAINITEKNTTVDKIKAAQLNERLADIYCQTGKHAEAQPLLLRALEFLQLAGKAETTNSASILWKLAKVELSQYNHATAVSFLRSSRSIYEKLSAGSTPKEVLEQMLSSCLELNMTNDLEPVLKQLIILAEKDNRSFAPDTAKYLEHLGDIYLSCGRKNDAQTQFQSAMQIHERCGVHADAQKLLKKLELASKV